MDAQRHNDIFDIYGMIHVPWWQQQFFKIMLGIVLVIVISLSIGFIIRTLFMRSKKRAPHEVALGQLQVLEKTYALHECDAERFYVRLLSIIKTYLAHRYSYNLEGHTDYEVEVFLEQLSVFPRDLIAGINNVVANAQKVKFANGGAVVETMHNDLLLVFRLVRETAVYENK